MTVLTYAGFPAASPLVGTELVPLMQGGVTSQSTVDALRAAMFGLVMRPSGDVTGVTDYNNCVAQWAVMAASGTPAGHYQVWLNGDYYFNQKAVFTFSLSSTGAFNRQYFILAFGARITQVTSNTGMFEFQVPASCTPIGPRIEGFEFTWSAIPLITDTASVAIGARNVDGTGGSPTGVMFNLIVRDCKVSNCFSFVANTQPAGTFQVQDVHIQNGSVNVYAGSVVKLAPPVTSGSPNVSVQYLLTAQPITALSTAGPTFPVISISGCDNVNLQSVEFLETTNQPLVLANSCGSVFLAGCKGEGCSFGPPASGFLYLFQFSNSYFEIADFSLNGSAITTGAGQAPIVIGALAGSAAQAGHCSNFTLANLSGTGTLTFFQNTGGGNGMALDMPTDPNIVNIGSVVFRLTNSGGAPNAAGQLYFSRNPAGKISANQGDASFTLSSPLSVPEALLWNSPLTVNRTAAMTITAGTVTGDNAWQGFKVRILRTALATGASMLTVTGLSTALGGGASVVVPIGGYLDLEWYQGLGLVEVGSGTI